MSGMGPSFTLANHSTALRVEPWVPASYLVPSPDAVAVIRTQKLGLGGGTFASVYKSKLGSDTIAVKTLRDLGQVGVTPQELLRAEAAMMLRVASPQVISLYGVTGALPGSDDPPCLLMEFARYGSLSSLLKPSVSIINGASRVYAPFEWWKRLRILTDVAKGMIRLHNTHPVVVHMVLIALRVKPTLMKQLPRQDSNDNACS